MPKQDIHLKFSKIYIIFIISLCLGCFLSINYLNAPLIAKSALIFLSILYSFYCLISMKNFRTLKYLGDNRWILTTHKKSYMGYVCGESVVTSKICILQFKLVGHAFKKNCYIFRDSLDGDIYRALLIELYAARALA